MEPVSHDLALASESRCVDVANHLSGLSAEFGTIVGAVGDRITISAPPITPAQPRAPEVYRDPSSLGLDAQAVLVRAAREGAITH
jgi:hypothetical protein